MTNWEQKIINEFISHYFASAPEPFDIDAKDNRTLRLRSSTFFPNFDTAHPDEKELYMDAAVFLEQKGITKLRWEKYGKNERLKTLSCNNFEALFVEAGKPFPQTEAKRIREFVKTKIINLKEKISTQKNSEAEKIITLMEDISLNFGPREIGQGLNQKAMEDLICFLEFSCADAAKQDKITTRALSILLYHNSKRLEEILALCTPLLTRSQKNLDLPRFVVPERAYPETMISGKLIFEFNNSDTPMVNTGGIILNLPLESTELFKSIKPIVEKNIKTVLTIENKETFYALGSLAYKGSPQKSLGCDECKNTSRYDCFLYTGGYPNRAAATLIKILASCNFTFYHAGDLDPDGILILQHVQDIARACGANRPVIPLRMDAVTFDQYRPWARTLEKSTLNQLKKIREETKAITGIAELIRRIEETGLGVEQEIIDYR